MYLKIDQNRAIVFLIVVLFIQITACEKEITVDLPLPKSKLVVEGHIEQGEYPYVYLSKNAPYFEATDLNTIQQYVVKNALITVSDGSVTDTLKELMPGFGYCYKATKLKGQIGKNYTLTIRAEGKLLTAVTSIIRPVKLDSVWFKITKSDSLGFIWAHLSEPKGMGNYYRLMTKRINNDVNNDFTTALNSVFDDRTTDGKSFDFVLSRGYRPNSEAVDYKNPERFYFKTGDLVVLKFCTIDENSYAFYKGYETEVANNGNPFANPVNIKTNISPSEDVLGAWTGYGVSLDTVLLIPK
jgi:hypothetical protein